jgi:hypothetical protein
MALVHHPYGNSTQFRLGRSVLLAKVPNALNRPGFAGGSNS